MTTKKILTALVVLALGWGSAACGSDDSPKAVFVDDANEICRNNREEWPEPKTNDDILAIYEAGARSGRAKIRQIRKLTPPPGDEDEVEEIIDALQTQNDKAEEYIELVKAGKLEEAKAFEPEWKATDDALTKVAKPYGLTDCLPPEAP